MDFLFLKLMPALLMLLAVVSLVGFVFGVMRDLFMMKETEHRRELEALDKQIELERVLRIPLAPDLAPPATDPLPDAQSLVQADNLASLEPMKEVPDVPAPPA